MWSLSYKEVQKTFKSGSSYVVTLPKEVVNELKCLSSFREEDNKKIVIKKRGKRILITDWKK